MIPGSANPLLLASAEADAYEIERSLRFNSSDSAYLSRTPSTAGNRKTWTWAGWVKRSNLGGWNVLFGASNGDALRYDANNTDKISFNNSGTALLITPAVYRDTSAWYHIVCSVNTTLSSNRVKLYVNGELATQGDPYIQNEDTPFNATAEHNIGRNPGTTTRLFDGYLADVHFIDGQALDPTSFGEFDTNGVWQPIAYAGSYGTNGFHLPFSDNSSAAALGTDTSGNGNTWTVNNISVTAGAANDSLVDVPTNGTETDTGVGGEVRGNYCTWNPLTLVNGGSLSNGNLDAVLAGGSSADNCKGTILVSSGKWYYEVTIGSGTNDERGSYGWITPELADSSTVRDGAVIFRGASATQQYYIDGSGTSYGVQVGTGDVIGCALDLDSNTTQWYINGSAQGSVSIPDRVYTPYLIQDTAATNTLATVVNFGQRPFAYAAPSGFKALCTANLPTPTIADGSTAMDVALYTGNGSTQTISGLNFSPDFIWFKARSSALSHQIFDQIRGVTKVLFSDSTAGEGTETDRLTAFNSDGFTLGTDAAGRVNGSGTTYVAWTWDAGSSTVTNTDGSITSTVRANASAGFSIVTYTGNGSAGATIGHGLGAAPQMIIVKTRNAARNWTVGHQGIASDPWTDYLMLNSTAAAADLNTVWNDTAPTSSVFTVGTANGVNANTETHVAYCFAPVDGYSSFGSYTGNGSTDGPFVYTGFRPRWLLYKNTAANNNWVLIDTSRDPVNVCAQYLYANSAQAEATYGVFDFLSNGFKARTGDVQTNRASNTYIYAAFAEHPFQSSRAR